MEEETSKNADKKEIKQFTAAEWELLDVPPIVKHANDNKSASSSSEGLLPTNSVNNNHKNEEKDKLCGYLSKHGARGIIKGWKVRWFVYDHRRCQLYYYRKPQDVEPLGNIDISNATFTFSTEEKASFQISSDERVYQLQAQDRNTMLFWLQELQARRRDYVKNQELSPTTSGKPASGLLSRNESLLEESTNLSNRDDLTEGFNTPVFKPTTFGNEQPMQNKENKMTLNLSFTNLNKEFKNWRKSAFFPTTGEPLTEDVAVTSSITSPISSSSSSSNFTTQTSIGTSSRNIENRPARHTRSVDFGFSKLVANLKPSMSTPNVSLPMNNSNEGNRCHKCEELQSIVDIFKEAVTTAEREIKAREEVIKSLNEQLMLNSGTFKVEKSPDEEVSEERELYIYQLTRMLEKQKEKLDDMEKQLEEYKNVRIEFNEKEKVWKELIKAKDNSIVSLTNKVFMHELNEKPIEVLEAVEVYSPTENLTDIHNNEMDIEQLKEACDAIRSQNTFLNSEILELIRLRKIDNENLKKTSQKVEQSEAEYLKLKSRYLCVLKEYSVPRAGNSDGAVISSEMVEHLIDDAINENGDQSVSAELRYSDRYGFYDEYDKDDDDSIDNIVDYLEVLSENIGQGSEKVSLGVKWENFFIAQGNAPLTKTEELKYLTRCGIPHEFRARVWKDLINLRISSDRNLAGTGYYFNLLNDKQGCYNPSSKQIELDLLRTLPNNKFYDKIESEGISKLRRILLAYSWHNPSVGYCQGLNRLAAIALLYLDEENAFWALVCIVEHLMPDDYFSRTLMGAQVDQRVFRDLIDEKVPKLGNHFNNLKFDLSLISFNWFLTVFVDFFPIELTFKVWDTYLFEGSKVLFRFALAVFKHFEEDLVKLTDAGYVFSFFRKIPRSKFNISKILNIAFVQLNPFGRKNIESKRKYYRPLLQTQLDEFELMRQEYRERRDSSIRDLDPSDDENE